MNEFNRSIQLRWADLDPNFHVRHSVYYDWGAFCRIEFLNNYGLTSQVMQQLQFGPIIFREECIFRKEIRLGEDIKIDLQNIRSKKRFFALEHSAPYQKDRWHALGHGGKC